MAKKIEVNNKKVPKKSIIRKSIEWEIPVQRIQQDVAKWRSATISAESIVNPYRIELYRLYKDIMLDAHISAVWNARKSEILGTAFLVYKKNKLQEAQTDFIQRKWFFDFIDYALDSKMWGHSLIQFGDINANEFTDVDLVPRAYVRPELNLVVPMYGAMTGEDFTQTPYKEWLLSIGKKDDLGLLLKLGPLYIWKKTALETWANYCQLFGTPMRILKTDTSDATALRNGQRMVKEMGNSLAAVIDKEDEIQILEAKAQSVGNTFQGLIDVCNAEISKLILGESSSTDPKAFVGSATIHEKTKNQMVLQDIVWLENIFKYQLIPFLNFHGLGFENCSVKIENDQQLTLDEKSKVIDILLKGGYTIPSEYLMETFGIPTNSEDGEVVANYKQEGLITEKSDANLAEDNTLGESQVREEVKDDLNNTKV